jgi:hypothetical protein
MKHCKTAQLGTRWENGSMGAPVGLVLRRRPSRAGEAACGGSAATTGGGRHDAPDGCRPTTAHSHRCPLQPRRMSSTLPAISGSRAPATPRPTPTTSPPGPSSRWTWQHGPSWKDLLVQDSEVGCMIAHSTRAAPSTTAFRRRPTPGSATTTAGCPWPTLSSSSAASCGLMLCRGSWSQRGKTRAPHRRGTRGHPGWQALEAAAQQQQ